MTVADRIRNERERRGWTQTELAHRCGYAEKTSVAKIEASGDNITSKKIQKLADVFGIRPAVLMGWVDDESVINSRTEEVVMNQEMQDIAKKYSEADTMTQQMIQRLLSYETSTK